MRFTVPFEAVIWTLALLALGLFGPGLAGHFTFCIPTFFGFDGCIGCGIGRSIGFALRGEWASSWTSHPMGIPAVLILTFHIARLIINANVLPYNQQRNQQRNQQPNQQPNQQRNQQPNQ